MYSNFLRLECCCAMKFVFSKRSANILLEVCAKPIRQNSNTWDAIVIPSVLFPQAYKLEIYEGWR